MLSLSNNRTVFVTMGSKGQFVFSGNKVEKIPAIPVEDPWTYAEQVMRRLRELFLRYAVEQISIMQLYLET